MKHTALATILGLLLIAPVAAAQVATGTANGANALQTRRPPIQRIVNSFRLRIQRGVRAGRPPPQARAGLRPDMPALPPAVRAGRQAGPPFTPTERQKSRREWRHTTRKIYRPNHNR